MKNTALTLIASALLAVTAPSQATTMYIFDPAQTGSRSVDAIEETDYLTFSGGGRANLGLLSFNLNKLGPLDLSQTYSAELALYQSVGRVKGAQFGLFVNTEAWSSAEFGWDQRPAHEADPVAVLSIGDFRTRTKRYVDVSSAVNDWLQGTKANYGFTFMRLDKGDADTWFSATLHEDAFEEIVFAPALVVEAVASAVPEPSTYGLMALGLGVLGAFTRRR